MATASLSPPTQTLGTEGAEDKKIDWHYNLIDRGTGKCDAAAHGALGETPRQPKQTHTNRGPAISCTARVGSCAAVLNKSIPAGVKNDKLSDSDD